MRSVAHRAARSPRPSPVAFVPLQFEKFLFDLSKISKVRQRVQALVTKDRFVARLSEVQEKVAAISNACGLVSATRRVVWMAARGG